MATAAAVPELLGNEGGEGEDVDVYAIVAEVTGVDAGVARIGDGWLMTKGGMGELLAGMDVMELNKLSGVPERMVLLLTADPAAAPPLKEKPFVTAQR